jgi:hypothetical protein
MKVYFSISMHSNGLYWKILWQLIPLHSETSFLRQQRQSLGNAWVNLLQQKRGNRCVTKENLNCSTRCSLVGTRITLRGLLAHCRPWPCESYETTKREVSDLRQWNMVTSPKGLGPKKDYDGDCQQHTQKTDTSSRQRGRLTKTGP